VYTSSHYQLAATCFDLATNERVVLENKDGVPDSMDRLQCALRIILRNEIEDPLQIVETSSTQPDFRHDLSLGRRTFAPDARASKYSNASLASYDFPDV